MAGDWLKWQKGLADKREVAIIAATLKQDRYAIAARLMKFWEWCDDNVPEVCVRVDGSAVITLSSSPDDNLVMIDSIVGLPGFAAALLSAGWLRQRSASIEIPNFNRHNGETAKTRARNALNQAARRTRSPKMSPPDGDKKVTREEKRREEKKESGVPDSPPYPPALDTPGFREAWSSWVAYRSARKLKRLVPQSVAAQFSKLAEIGPDRAVAAIQHSIRQAYHGIFEDKEKSQPSALFSGINEFLANGGNGP